jgi:Rrf2 family protein
LFVASKFNQGVLDFISTQQISHDLNIPPSTAGMILRRLNRASLIETREGVNGGVRLALRPEQVTLLDIFMAIEQERPMFQTNIQMRLTGEKPTRVQQIVTDTLAEAETAMKDSLEGVTLRDLINEIHH